MHNAFLLCLPLALISVNANNEFIIPPPAGLDVTFNSPVIVEWRCDDCGSRDITLNLWQNKNDGNWAQETLLENVVDPGNYSWAPHTLDGLTTANGFHFNVVCEDLSFDSGAMFIRDEVSSSSASASSTASSIPSTQMPSTSPTAHPVTRSSTTSSISSEIRFSSTEPALSTSILGPTNLSPVHNNDTLKVGLGVGLGIGIPFLLLIGGLVGYLIFRMHSRDRHNVAYEPTDGQEGFSIHYGLKREAQELSGDTMRHELPGK
ncbi:hypothetical protein BDV96DRAFT_642414 [Lophiotrema nucula]|uniref:Mid2 domain-containing protein n=1 Tax=Lophiotrema nucula TaxID=690887 RepID=A0A6A5ZKK1_9PLEO|nr:hypothetical protein BDV96DRAFT_642414 [Lophiotrema nucula]